MDEKDSFTGFLWPAVLCVLLFLGCVQSGNTPENNSVENNVTTTEAASTTSSTSVAQTTSLKPTTTTISAPSPATTTTSLIPVDKMTVVIENHSFNPENITVAVGAIVTWVNNDSSEHQIISDVSYAGNGGGFSRQLFDLKSPRLFRGSTYSYRFQRAGNYTYHCNIYPMVHGGVQVIG